MSFSPCLIRVALLKLGGSAEGELHSAWAGKGFGIGAEVVAGAAGGFCSVRAERGRVCVRVHSCVKCQGARPCPPWVVLLFPPGF